MEKTIYLYDDEVGRVDYIEHMGDDLTIVNSARVSFGKTKEKMDARDEQLVSYLLKHRHTSTLEHNVVTFRFVVPLYIRSQHMRHRTWSYNEISRRYTSKDLQFYEPKNFRGQHKRNRQASDPKKIVDPIIFPDLSDLSYGVTASQAVYHHHKNSVELYNKMLSTGVCREQARGVLPQNLYTEYYGTVNLNNLLKFIDLRIHDGAQQEIQKVAEACLEIAMDLWPITVSTYRKLRIDKQV